MYELWPLLKTDRKLHRGLTGSRSVDCRWPKRSFEVISQSTNVQYSLSKTTQVMLADNS